LDEFTEKIGRDLFKYHQIFSKIIVHLFFIELYILSKNNIFEIVIDKIRDLSVFSAKLSCAKCFGLI
jgi:hypothetical protein